MLDFEEASDGLYQSQAAQQLQLQVIWGWGRQSWSGGSESDGSMIAGVGWGGFGMGTQGKGPSGLGLQVMESGALAGSW